MSPSKQFVLKESVKLAPNGTNYREWAFATENKIIQQKLRKYLYAERRNQISNYDEEDDLVACSYINLSIHQDNIKYVQKSASEKASRDIVHTVMAWKKLQQIYEGTMIANKLQLLHELATLRWTRDTQFDSFIDEFKECVRKLVEAGDTTPEVNRVHELLYKLPKEYESRVDTIMSSIADGNPKYTTLNNVIIELKIVTNRIKYKHNENENTKRSSHDDQAFHAGEKHCFYCKKYGHRKYECLRRQRDEADGIFIDSLRDRNKDSQAQKHVTFNLTNTGKRGFRNPNQQKRNKNSDHANTGYEDWSQQKDEHLFSITDADGPKPQDPDVAYLIIDSGATAHMTGDLSLLHDVESCSRSVCLADGHPINVKYKGKPRLQSNSTGEVATFRDTLYVPTLQKSLIPISQITHVNPNAFVIFKGSTANIMVNSKIILQAIATSSKLYLVDASLILPTNHDSCEKVNVAESSSGELWHARLGHPPLPSFKAIMNATVGGPTTISSLRTCEACIKGYITDIDRPSEGDRGRKPFGTCIHADTWGPAQTSSPGGCKYFVAFTEDFTNYVQVYPIKTKSSEEVFDCFKRFHVWLTARTLVSVNTFRSDNGTEFVNAEFSSYLTALGIQHERSVPYRQYQNGTAERMNRTLVEMARTLLIHFNAHPRWWAEAVYTAAFLRNRTPNVKTGNLTPHELITKTRPNIANLKVFGCICYRKLDSTPKLNSKASKCMFIGYSLPHKGYKLYDLELKKVVIAVDVKFLEQSFPTQKPALQDDEHRSTDDHNVMELDIEDSTTNSSPQPAQTQTATEVPNSPTSSPSAPTTPSVPPVLPPTPASRSTDSHSITSFSPQFSTPQGQSQLQFGSMPNIPVITTQLQPSTQTQLQHQTPHTTYTAPLALQQHYMEDTDMTNDDYTSDSMDNTPHTIGHPINQHQFSTSSTALAPPQRFAPSHATQTQHADDFRRHLTNALQASMDAQEAQQRYSRQPDIHTYLPTARPNTTDQEFVEPPSKTQRTAMSDRGITTAEYQAQPPTTTPAPTPPLTIQDHAYLPKVDSDDDEALHTEACFHASTSDHPVPSTFWEAIKSSDANAWLEACRNEWSNLVNMGCFIVVPEPAPKSAMTSKWVFKIKQNPNGTTTHKARLVLRGFNQKYGVDYFQTYSPTVSIDAMRMVLAIATQHKMVVHYADATNAYIHANLDIPQHMRAADGIDCDNSWHLLAVKGIYGTKQGALMWHKHCVHIMSSIGFHPLKSDQCVFKRTTNGELEIITLYVDDFLVCAATQSKVESIIKALQKYIRINDLGPVTKILGIQIKRNIKEGITTISQEEYITQMCQKYRLEQAKPVSTPIPVGTDLSDVNSPLLPNNKEYQAIVGSLLYCSCLTLPDITHAVSQLSRYLNEPRQLHLSMAKRVIKYLNCTKTLCIRYQISDQSNKGQFFCYSDASWADDKPTGRSTCGFIWIMCNGPIAWKSKLQSLVCLSTSESEYVGACIAAQHGCFLVNLLTEMLDINLPSMVMFLDNQSAIHIASNQANMHRTKHLALRYHFLRDLVESNQVILRYCPRNSMMADILTKHTTTSTLLNNIAALGMGGCYDYYQRGSQSVANVDSTTY